MLYSIKALPKSESTGGVKVPSFKYVKETIVLNGIKNGRVYFPADK